MSEKQPIRITSQQGEGFRRVGFTGNVLVNADHELGFSAITVDVFGAHPLKQMVGATRSYFVLSGTGRFTLNGEEIKVAEGDLVVIPDGGIYKYAGIMKLFEFNVPATTSEHSITLEE